MSKHASVHWLSATEVCRENNKAEKDFWLNLAQEFEYAASRHANKAETIELYGLKFYMREESGAGLQLADLSVENFHKGVAAHAKEKLKQKSTPFTLDDASRWMDFEQYTSRRSTLTPEARGLAWNELRDLYEQAAKKTPPAKDGSLSVTLGNGFAVRFASAGASGCAERYWISNEDAAALDTYAQKFQPARAGAEWTSIEKLTRSPATATMQQEMEDAFERAALNPESPHLREVEALGRTWEVGNFGKHSFDQNLHIRTQDVAIYKSIGLLRKNDHKKGAIAEFRTSIKPDDVRESRKGGSGFFEL